MLRSCAARSGSSRSAGYLFSRTVASNLRYGRPDATESELWAALEVAQARAFVEEMPDGLDDEPRAVSPPSPRPQVDRADPSAIGAWADDRSEGDALRTVGETDAGADASGPRQGRSGADARRRQCRPVRGRTQDPGAGHRPDLRRCVWPATTVGYHQGPGRRGGARLRRRARRGHDRGDGQPRSGTGHRLLSGGRGTLDRAGRVHGVVTAGLAAGIPAQRRRAGHRLPVAGRGRGEDPPTSARLLRPATERRAAQPGHQRHR